MQQRKIFGALILLAISFTLSGSQLGVIPFPYGHPDCVENLFRILNTAQIKTHNRQLNKLLKYTPFYHNASHPKTFGVEVELQLPEIFGQEGVAQYIAKRLNEINPQIKPVIDTHSYSNIMSRPLFEQSVNYTLKDHGIEKKMTIHVRPEFFLPSSSEKVVCEVVSPILTSVSEFQQFTRLIHELKTLNAVPFPRSAGVHIHYGVPKLSDSELRLIYYLFSAIEDELFVLFKKQPTREMTKPLKKNYGLFDHIIDSSESFITSDFVTKKAFFIRYAPEYGTFELRIANSTLHHKIIEYSAIIVDHLVSAIREKDHILFNYLAEHYPERTLSMEKIFELTQIKVHLDPQFKKLIDDDLIQYGP